MGMNMQEAPPRPAPENLAAVIQRVDADNAAPSLHPIPHGRVTCFSARSPEKDPPNEDALAVLATHGGAVVLAVADGMGGQASGDQAARITITAIRDAVAGIEADDAASETSRIRPAVLDGIEAANREVLALGVGAGATLAVAEVTGPSCRSYHVGDAAIVQMGQRGKVKYASIAHSPVGYAEAAGMLDPEAALHHEDRHFVSNHIGSPDMRIEIGPTLKLGRFDTLLLATDGLTDNVSLLEIVELLRAGPLEGAAKALAQTARGRMLDPEEGLPSKNDDMTFVAFRPEG